MGQLFAIAKLSYQLGNLSNFSTNNKSKNNTDLSYKMNQLAVRNYIVTDESEDYKRKKVINLPTDRKDENDSRIPEDI